MRRYNQHHSMMTVLINNNNNQSRFVFVPTYRSFHNHISHILAIKVCQLSDNHSSFKRGKSIHHKMQCEELQNVHLLNTLIAFYAHYGDLENALNVFHSIPVMQ
eukprot:TRINITY_DN20217_c0_g1_i1.p1 TRINITY_DN20217_c0_g1~~TRINITY_DN20217_c0_g1_i1.p1  ORF type:complete len:104 (+),score=2.98 TRINITY_DN20217_c0_g1_i1:10-321(+)